MRSKTSKWFEIKFRFQKAMNDGTRKMVNEPYVVEALSFGEAEKNIIEEMKPYVVEGEYKVKSITPASYGEIFFSDNDDDDKWYNTKLVFITIDEKTEKEKRSNVNYLVQAKSTEAAQKNVKEIMNRTMIDYDILSINETKILDVFEHKAGDKTKTSSKSSESIDEFE